MELDQNSIFFWSRVCGVGPVWQKSLGAELQKVEQSSPKQTLSYNFDSSSALLRLIFSDMLQMLPAGNNRLTHWTMGPTCHLYTTPIGHYIPRASKPTYPQAGGV